MIVVNFLPLEAVISEVVNIADARDKKKAAPEKVKPDVPSLDSALACEGSLAVISPQTKPPSEPEEHPLAFIVEIIPLGEIRTARLAEKNKYIVAIADEMCRHCQCVENIKVPGQTLKSFRHHINEMMEAYRELCGLKRNPKNMCDARNCPHREKAQENINTYKNIQEFYPV